MSDDYKIVFIDAEFTGEHQCTTLVSLGLVTLQGAELYLTVNDYDTSQVTDWLQENVLSKIDESARITSVHAYGELHRFLENYAQGKSLYVVSCGLLQDYILMLELYKYAHPEQRYFHALHCLPEYLNHYAAIDLNTLFRVCGFDPALDRIKFAGMDDGACRHNALYDARVVRACFMRMTEKPPMKALLQGLRH